MKLALHGKENCKRHIVIKKLPKQLWKNTGKAKFKIHDQQKWFELLAELLTTGFSLKEAVDFTRILLPDLKEPISKINKELKNGHPLAYAVSSWVSIDTFYQLLLAEQHGQLLSTLRHFSGFLNLRIQQTNKLKRLLQYPLLLCVLLVVIMLVMTTLVFPQLQQLESSFHNEIWHEMGRILVALAGGVATWLVYRWVAFYHLNKLDQVRQMCNLPVMGQLFRYYYGHYLCLNLSLLIVEGLSMQKIIQLCNSFSADSLLYQLSTEMQKLIVQGGDIDQLIRREPFIPDELLVLIHQGTTSDKLGLQVRSLATNQFKLVLQGSESRLAFVQPMIYLIIAGTILGLYLQMLLPIYQTMQVMK